MNQKRNEQLATVFLILVLLGVAVMLFERPTLHTPLYWPDVVREVMGLAGGLLCLGLLIAGWSKGKTPTLELWQTMTLAQKSLLWLCCALVLRSISTLLLLPFSQGRLLAGIIVALQVSGGVALALLIVPVFVKVYRNQFKDPPQSNLEKWKRLFDATFFAAWAVWLVTFFFRLLYWENDTLAVLDWAGYISLLIVALSLGGTSVIKLPEKKAKWVVGLAVSILTTAYAIYSLYSLL